jgi:S-adenosylmethionine synthetase
LEKKRREIMEHRRTRTAEHVSEGHPDKFCDQVADKILDEVLSLAGDDKQTRAGVRTAIECLAKDDILTVSGEVKLPDDIRGRLHISDLARQVWKKIGYGNEVEGLEVRDEVRSQTPDIAQGVDSGGAGDQGIMIGYATDETPEFMPDEWLYARNICLRLAHLRKTQILPWLRSDCKSQVTLGESGQVLSVIIAAQHSELPAGVTEGDFLQHVRSEIVAHVIQDVLPNAPNRLVVNGTGTFVIGGPAGDAGVVGRKIVVDAYGPRVPVGGGAYSGKDPTKVDRSAAYMARHIAKCIVAHKIGDARQCIVKLAYGIGQLQPEMVTAITDQNKDLSDWVKSNFDDLSPRHIIESLGLRDPSGWSYLDTAAYGHYGRDIFPWETVR